MRLILAALVALLLAGCGSASGAEPKADVGAEQDVAAPAKKAAAKAASPMKFLKRNYSETAWYPHITDAHQVGSVTWIETDLGPGAKKAGAKICGAVSAWQFKTYHEFRGVTVRSKDGNRLSRRVSVGDPC